MSLLRAAQRASRLLQSSNFSYGACLMQRNTLRCFSTDSGAESEQRFSPIDPILQARGSGSVYGRVSGFNIHSMKSDIINLFDGSNLAPDDVKVSYNKMFNPVSVLVRFPSHSDFVSAIRTIPKKGRFIRLDKTDESEWDITTPYNGKYVLLEGISSESYPEDVHRFLNGYNYDSSSFEMFVRMNNKMVVVRFPSQAEAMSTAIRLNRGFVNNAQVRVRVLQ